MNASQLTLLELSKIELEIDQIANILDATTVINSELSDSYEVRLEELIKTVEGSLKQTRRSEVGLRLI